LILNEPGGELKAFGRAQKENIDFLIPAIFKLNQNKIILFEISNYIKTALLERFKYTHDPGKGKITSTNDNQTKTYVKAQKQADGIRIRQTAA
jgi:hypothetical protein